MPLKLNLTVPHTVDPVSDTEQKLHAKIDLPDDDALVSDLNKTATDYIGDRLQRDFTEATWELSLNAFPPAPCPIEICRVPLISIESIKYIDTAGVEQTLAASEYKVDDKAEPAAVFRAFNVTWPTTRTEVNAVTVTFKAGYGALATDVPEKFKTIIKHMFTHLYEHREPMKDKQWVEIPEHLNALLGKYELKVFG